MGAVKNLCKRGIVLNQGQVAFDGGVEEAVGYYTNNNTINKIWRKEISDTRHLNRLKDVQFLSVEFAKKNNEFASDEPIEFIFTVFANKTVDDCRINLTIFSIDGNPIGSVSNTQTFKIKEGEIKKISLTLRDLFLAKGLYDVSFATGIGNLLTCQRDFDFVPHIIGFSITQLSANKSEDVAQWDRNWGNIIWKGQTQTME